MLIANVLYDKLAEHMQIPINTLVLGTHWGIQAENKCLASEVNFVFSFVFNPRNICRVPNTLGPVKKSKWKSNPCPLVVCDLAGPTRLRGRRRADVEDYKNQAP